jgi:phospholipase C
MKAKAHTKKKRPSKIPGKKAAGIAPAVKIAAKIAASPAAPLKTPLEHVVIIFKENHGFDNYFGTFPGANGDGNLPHLPDPPLNDPPHTHEAWLKRAANAVRGQYHESDIPHYFALAKQFVLCDNYYTDVAGPSTPNHLMVIAADSPVINNPHPKDPKQFQPPFNLPSLPENLQKAGFAWKNYGGFAFNYIANLKHNPGNVIADQFAQDAASGTLAHVSWVYGPKNMSEHPTERVADGDAWTAAQIKAIIQGGLWPTTAIFITWDDWGGWYDHVTPPEIEKWKDGTQFRYGNRVGCIVASPYAKSGYISHVLHSHVSIVKFCETIFGLPAINQRDSAADDMFDCFDFTQSPLNPPT